MAEAVFQNNVQKAGLAAFFEIDSAGTGDWHVGEPAHIGTQRVLQKHAIPYNGRARQIASRDMSDPNTTIIAMDEANLAELQRRFGSHPRLFRLLDFAQHSHEKNVPDPYYSGKFDEVYELVSDGCRGLLEAICQREQLPVPHF